MIKRLVILVHRHDAFEKKGYFLREMARVWEQNGLSVRVLNGPAPDTDADLAILHVNWTVVPEDYLAFIRRYPRVLNGRVQDISKRFISRNLVECGDGWQGPVIVKTNRNHGGLPEARQTEPETTRLTVPDYRVFDSSNQVPEEVWRDGDLVVERFLPERRDGYYCLRTWTFLGDKEMNSLSYSARPIIKSGSVVRREIVSEVPNEIRSLREELGFDFGKFDYAIVDGRAVLYDANRTPALGHLPKERFLPGLRLLAEGIRAYL